MVEVGGGLRSYTVGDVDILAGYAVDEVATSGRGQLLMPWPNRIRDGRYAFDGSERQLALTEPAKHNASHGLVRWGAWQLESQDATSVSVRHELFPQPGWDGHFDLRVRYDLGEHGLTVRSTATNIGAVAAPFGYGAHPYLAIGDTPLAEVGLTLPGAREVLVDDRSLPTRTVPVRPEVDFRTARPLGTAKLDTAYTDLTREDDGRWTVTLEPQRGRAVAVWGDEAFGWVQVFTAKGEDTGVDGPRGIAVEPMSCPADAFNSGQGLVVLTPGESWTGTWGISPTPA